MPCPQFYITTAPNRWMDKGNINCEGYVSFGRVIDGLDTVMQVAAEPTLPNQCPKARCEITDCGVLVLDWGKVDDQ